jgi:hypothetical protein
MWTLLIFAYVGAMGTGDSVALTNITGFKTEAACVAAALPIKRLDQGTTKNILTACVEVK